MAAAVTLRLAAAAAALAAAACDAAPVASPNAESPTRAGASGAATGHARMLTLLAAIRERAPADNIYHADDRVRDLEARLAALPADAPPRQRFSILFELGDLLVLLGSEREGIARIEEALRYRPALNRVVPPGQFDELALRLGSAWMRVGETENCCARNTPGACILPIEGEALHTKAEGSKKAMAIFAEILAGTDASEFAKLQATWLLNIAAMTLGEYPGGVPAAHRIPPAYFAPDEDFPHFSNVASKVGLDTFGLAGGCVADDFDEDGDIDILSSDFDPGGQLRYFRNEGNGTFAERTGAAGLTGLFGGLNMVQADYDNDGHVDVLVLRGAWLGVNGRDPKSLLHNNGDGTFTDRTFEAGLGEVHWPSQTAAWSDIDGDGDLDVFVGNETVLKLEAPCQLFRNNGNGTFTDIAVAAGVTNDGFTKGVAAGDFDGDRLPDFYVSNLGQPNRLYRNLGNGKFEDVAPAKGMVLPKNGFPVFPFDCDNDGALDILALPFYVSIADLAAAALGRAGDADTPHLYRGDGRGNFTDVTKAVRLARPCSVMGSNFGDLDNDGFLDLYLGTGAPPTRALMPNLMFRNRGGVDFADVSLPAGAAHLQKGHAVCFADFDQDGDLDVYEEIGGAYRGDKFRDVLFENPGFGNQWLAVLCVGTKSNRSAVGARIRAEIVEDGKRRSVYRTVGSGGTFGCNPLRQHLGLGKAARVELLEVFWPTTGETQTFRDVAVDQLVEVTEGSAKLVTRAFAPQRLGKAASER